MSITFPPHLIDEGCGHALRAWVGGCGFVHAACVLRISTATSGSPTNVIDFGIFEPTAFSRNVFTNHRALEIPPSTKLYNINRFRKHPKASVYK